MNLIGIPAIWTTILCALPVLILAGIARLRSRYRQLNERSTVNEKILRSPGESIRRKLETLDEGLYQTLMIILSCAFVTTHFAHKEHPAFIIGYLIFSAASAMVLYLRAMEAADYSLGLSGERVVGEELNRLMLQGCYVFHDVPKSDGTNIDHVVIAQGGVFAIETKTRRKYKTTRGTRDYEIIFDGKQLQFPKWRDSTGIDQVKGNARWLSDYLSKSLAEPIYVTPVLTFPGWMVISRVNVDLKVLNPKQIASLIRSDSAVLTRKQMDQIAARLDERCRDVEF